MNEREQKIAEIQKEIQAVKHFGTNHVRVIKVVAEFEPQYSIKAK